MSNKRKPELLLNDRACSMTFENGFTAIVRQNTIGGVFGRVIITVEDWELRDEESTVFASPDELLAILTRIANL